jgi:predicted nucleic acid-binding protein
MRRGATFDSSFWVHAVYVNLVDFLLEDFALVCARSVERELGRENPTSLRLKSMLADKTIQRATANTEKLKLYGDGERGAINLALERNITLLIDDWRPYEAAQAAGLQAVNSLAYVAQLYQQERIGLESALATVGRLARRGTLRPEWIQSVLKIIAELRKKGEKH